MNAMLVLGHAASGKSAWAERHVETLGGNAIYIATARVMDAEMRAKVAAHAARRGPQWSLTEAPRELASACGDRPAGDTILIDCATMWLTNLVMEDRDWAAPAEAWISAMRASPARFVVVSNDVGGGVTPENALARAFQRAQGALNQRLAADADEVVLVTAGLPLRLK